MRPVLKVFQGDALLYKVLNLLLLPFMAIASTIALVVYLSLMALTVVAIQFAGCLLGIYSFLKWLYDATWRVITGEPLPARK